MTGNNFSQTYGPALGSGVVHVTSQFVGQSLINSIRKQLPKQKMQRGDAYMDGVRYLLRTNFDFIEKGDRPKIDLAYNLAVGMKKSLDACNDSKIQRFWQARDYKCLSKKLFVVVKSASDRGLDKSLLEQNRREMRETGPDPPDTSSDPPAASFPGSSVNSLDEIEMTTFRSEITGDMAVSLILRGKDGKDAVTQDTLTIFSPGTITDENADNNGPSITLAPEDESSVLDTHAKADEER